MATENGNSVEMNTIPRSASANRFQVNLVNKDSNGGGGVGEVEDEDEFNEETEMVQQRRTSRIQAIRSSIRDSTSEKKRKESVTRFKVSDENSDSGEDENLLDGNEYDTKYGRSFRYATVNLSIRDILKFILLSSTDISPEKRYHVWIIIETSCQYKQEHVLRSRNFTMHQ